MLVVRLPASEAELAAARELIAAYAFGLAQDFGMDLGFQDYDEEMATFPDHFCAVLLAFRNGAPDPIGIVALKRLSEAICEMKRMYCLPHERGRGVGRALAEAVIAEARRRGFRRMRLDTLEGLTAARALYADLGFEVIAPYYCNPYPGVKYMERAL